MKEYVVEAGFITISSGTIKLSEGQASKRMHALQKTKKEGIYTVTGKCGFKKGEVISLDDAAVALLKSGSIVDKDSEKAALPAAEEKLPESVDDQPVEGKQLKFGGKGK